MNWNEFFFRHVYLVALKSKDPSTQIGAVLVNPEDKAVIASGYNGFPRGVKDTYERLNDRSIKYELVVHAEVNAIVDCARRGVCCKGAILYTNAFPCSNCSKVIAQSGLTKVIIHKEYEELFYNNASREGQESWNKKRELTELLLSESGVITEVYSGVLGVSVLLNQKLVSV